MPISQLHAQPPLYVGTCTTHGCRSARLPSFYGRYLQVVPVPRIAPARCAVVCCRIWAAGIGAPVDHVSPNPPMDGARIAEGGEEVTDATVRARIRVDWRLAGGLSALLGVLIAACDGCGERAGGIGHGKKHSRTGPGASWRGS